MKKGLFILMSMIFVLALFVNLVSAMTATINIPERYSEVVAGERIYFETEIKWPENDMRRDLRMEYSIKNPKGEEIAYLKVLKAIETQASFMDSINIPESSKNGIYKIYLTINDYDELNQEVVASFNVRNKTSFLNLYLPLILCFFALSAILILVELFILINKKN
jgi:hypothetical protein